MRCGRKRGATPAVQARAPHGREGQRPRYCVLVHSAARLPASRRGRERRPTHARRRRRARARTRVVDGQADLKPLSRRVEHAWRQRVPVGLPGRGGRQCVDDDHALRGLEPRHATRLEPRGAASTSNDGRRRRRPQTRRPSAGRDSRRRRRGGPRVRFELVLDLRGRDVLAAPDDHVLEAADDREPAVAVERREVAGAEPAVGVEASALCPASR